MNYSKLQNKAKVSKFLERSIQGAEWTPSFHSYTTIFRWITQNLLLHPCLCLFSHLLSFKLYSTKSCHVVIFTSKICPLTNNHVCSIFHSQNWPIRCWHVSMIFVDTSINYVTNFFGKHRNEWFFTNLNISNPKRLLRSLNLLRYQKFGEQFSTWISE